MKKHTARARIIIIINKRVDLLNHITFPATQLILSPFLIWATKAKKESLNDGLEMRAIQLTMAYYLTTLIIHVLNWLVTTIIYI